MRHVKSIVSGTSFFSRLSILLCLSVIYLCSAHKEQYSQPIWDDQLNHSEIERRLQREHIVEATPLARYLKTQGRYIKATHDIQLLALESGLKGVFKTGNYHYAEVAAYRLSALLELRLVPPTVFRTLDGVQGSLQLYIEAPDLAAMGNPKERLKKVGKKALSDMNLFYYVAGQWDTHLGNQLIAKSNRGHFLGLIDNSGMLHRSYSLYGGVNFIEKGDNSSVPSDKSPRFPFECAITVKGDYYKKILPVFSPYITQAHIKALSRSLSLSYVIWDDTLWIQRSSKGIPRKTSTYYASTLRKLEALTEEQLLSIWSEWFQVEPEHAKKLVQETLIRRDQVLQASKKGRILHD